MVGTDAQRKILPAPLNATKASSDFTSAASIYKSLAIRGRQDALGGLRAVHELRGSTIEHARDDHIVTDPFAEPLTRQIAPQLALG